MGITGLILLLAAPPAGADVASKVRASHVRALLKNVEGVQVLDLGDQVVVDGDVSSREDFDRVLKVVNLYPETRSLVTLHPQVPVSRADEMEKKIHALAGCENVFVSFVNGTFFLDGEVTGETRHRAALELAESLLPELQTSEALKQDALTAPVKRPAIRDRITVRNR